MRVSQRASRWLLLVLGVTTCVYAQQLAELSDEFLEYLGSLEGDEEDWMDFAVTAKSGNTPVAQAPSSQSAALAKASSSSSSSSSSSVMSKAAAQAGGKAEK